MLSILILGVLLLVSNVSCVFKDICVDRIFCDGDEEVRMGNPKDCSQYFVCEGTSLYPHSCPEGTKFDVNFAVCQKSNFPHCQPKCPNASWNRYVVRKTTSIKTTIKTTKNALVSTSSTTTTATTTTTTTTTTPTSTTITTIITTSATSTSTTTSTTTHTTTINITTRNSFQTKTSVEETNATTLTTVETLYTSATKSKASTQAISEVTERPTIRSSFSTAEGLTTTTKKSMVFNPCIHCEDQQECIEGSVMQSPYDCHDYYKCSSKMWTLEQCPRNDSWNVLSGDCKEGMRPCPNKCQAFILNDVHVLNEKLAMDFPNVLKEGSDVTFISQLRMNLPSISHIVKWYKDGHQINEKANIRDERIEISMEKKEKIYNCDKCRRSLNNPLKSSEEEEYPPCSQIPYYISENKLTIKNLRLYDIGKYKCEVHYFIEDPGKGTVEASLEIKNIVPLPQISIRKTLSGRKEFEWTIICEANLPSTEDFLQEPFKNLATNFRYKWFIDDFEITMNSEEERARRVARMVTSEVLSMQNHSTLYLGTLKKDAFVTCSVSNYAGTKTSEVITMHAFNGEDFCSGLKEDNIVWPPTKASTAAVLPCPPPYIGLMSRDCDDKGKWWPITDNQWCVHEELLRINETMKQLDVYNPSNLVLDYIKDVSNRLVKFQKNYPNQTMYEKIIAMSIIEKIVDKKINAYMQEPDEYPPNKAPDECICIYDDSLDEWAFQNLVSTNMEKDKVVNYTNIPFKNDVVFKDEENRKMPPIRKKMCKCGAGQIDSKKAANQTLQSLLFSLDLLLDDGEYKQAGFAPIPPTASPGHPGPGQPPNYFKSIDKVAMSLTKLLDPGQTSSYDLNNLAMDLYNKKQSIQKDVSFPITNLTNINSHTFFPKNSLENYDSINESLYLTYVLYKNADKYFPTKENVTINSHIMSMSMGTSEQASIHNLSAPINLVFQNKDEIKEGMERLCSYWDINNQSWSQEGCMMRTVSSKEFAVLTNSDEVDEKSMKNYTVCECNHLTNFAILMSPFNADERTTLILSIISTVGCVISIIAMVLALIIFAVRWSKIKSHHMVVVINLCIALIIANVIFLGGVDRVDDWLACKIVATLLHYFYLAAFFLMLAEGVELLLYLVFVFHARRKKETASLIVMAWVIPLFIVAISLIVTRTVGYGSERSCWLSVEGGLIWAFVGPVLCILFINFIIFVVVMTKVFGAKRPVNKEKVKYKVKSMVWGSFVIIPILGLTWVFGVLAINQQLIAFQYIFAIANSLQGLLIFLFHALRSGKKSQSSSSGKLTSSSSSSTQNFLRRLKLNKKHINKNNNNNNSYDSNDTFKLKNHFDDKNNLKSHYGKSRGVSQTTQSTNLSKSSTFRSNNSENSDQKCFNPINNSPNNHDLSDNILNYSNIVNDITVKNTILSYDDINDGVLSTFKSFKTDNNKNDKQNTQNTRSTNLSDTNSTIVNTHTESQANIDTTFNNNAKENEQFQNKGFTDTFENHTKSDSFSNNSSINTNNFFVEPTNLINLRQQISSQKKMHNFDNRGFLPDIMEETDQLTEQSPKPIRPHRPLTRPKPIAHPSFPPPPPPKPVKQSSFPPPPPPKPFDTPQTIQTQILQPLELQNEFPFENCLVNNTSKIDTDEPFPASSSSSSSSPVISDSDYHSNSGDNTIPKYIHLAGFKDKTKKSNSTKNYKTMNNSGNESETFHVTDTASPSKTKKINYQNVARLKGSPKNPKNILDNQNSLNSISDNSDVFNNESCGNNYRGHNTSECSEETINSTIDDTIDSKDSELKTKINDQLNKKKNKQRNYDCIRIKYSSETSPERRLTNC